MISVINATAVMEELESLGNQFQEILGRYLKICTNMDNLSSREGVLPGVPQEFLDRIGAEITRFISCKQRLGQAEATVCRVRNRLSQLTPISSLPPEILVHIFHMVANPCDLLVPDFESPATSTSSSSSEVSDTDSNDLRTFRSETLQLDNFPTHLDRLTHVCSYWRQTAINSPSLWVHIDIVPHRLLHRGFLVRARTYAARAGGQRIELHVADDKPLKYNATALTQFLSSNRDRIETLEIAVIHGWRSFHGLIFDELFNLTTSGPANLTKLRTICPVKDDLYDEFIDWIDDNDSNFGRLTTLQLRGLFPLWESTAYHNLVDLRLNSSCDEHWTIISESQFRRILEASPRLRVLQFSLHITDRKRDDEPVIPVHLNDLEVLGVSSFRGQYERVLKPGYVFRLLAPGSKPLRISVLNHFYLPLGEDGSGGHDDFSQGELLKLFQRSNVSGFHTKYGCPKLSDLLPHAPNLEELAFDSCSPLQLALEWTPKSIPRTPCLNSLTFRACFLHKLLLEVLLQMLPTNRLELSASELSQFTETPGDLVSIAHVLTVLEEFPNTRLEVCEKPFLDPITKWSPVD